MTPRIFGKCSSGSGESLSGTIGCDLYCRLSDVKSVMVDFCADICRFLPAAQAATSCAWLAMVAAACSTSGGEAEAVKSSAYEVQRSAVCG